MKQRIAAFLAACVLFLAAPHTLRAQEEKPYLVALGDSITTGYEMAGGRYGNAGYVNLTAADLGLSRGEYINCAVNGYTVPDLLQLLPLFEEDIARADILVFDIGYNDVLQYVYSSIAMALGAGSMRDIRAAGALLSEEDVAEMLIRLDEEASGQMYTALYEAFDAGLHRVLDTLREYNADAPIYMQSLYNPLAALDVMNEFSNRVMGTMNDILRRAAEEYGCRFLDVFSAFAGHEHAYTNMDYNDIHPNEAGHEAIHKLFAAALREDGFLLTDGTKSETTAEPETETEPVTEPIRTVGTEPESKEAAETGTAHETAAAPTAAEPAVRFGVTFWIIGAAAVAAAGALAWILAHKAKRNNG